MADDLNNQHLSAEGIQALLEGELPGGEAVALEEHASSCARCQAELEAWRLLFAELAEMPRMTPAAGFRDRVMENVEIPARVPLLERLKGWLRGRGAAAAGALDHVAPERLQDYVEGVLPAGRMARVRSHLEACGRCRRQEAAWRSVFARLGSLPRVEPSAGFARRVMEGVRIPERVPAPVEPSLWDRTAAGVAGWVDGLRPVAGSLAAMARKLQPRTRRAWTLVGSAVAAPVTVVAGLALYLAANPLLSVANLVTFLWWKSSEATVGLAQAVTDGLVESTLAAEGYALVEQLSGSMSMVAGTVGAFCVLTILSLYVLYRNLIATRPVEQRYVHFSF